MVQKSLVQTTFYFFLPGLIIFGLTFLINVSKPAYFEHLTTEDQNQSNLRIDESFIPFHVWIVVTILALLFGIISIYFKFFRCFSSMLLPSLISARGRLILLIIILQLLFNGPLNNFLRNSAKFIDIVECLIKFCMDTIQKELLRGGYDVGKYSKMFEASTCKGSQVFLNFMNGLNKRISDDTVFRMDPFDIHFPMINRTFTVGLKNETIYEFTKNDTLCPELTFRYDFIKISASKDLEEITRNFSRDMIYGLEKFLAFINFASNVFTFSILLIIVFTSFRFYRYYTDLEYNNVYLSNEFFILDKKRKKENLPSILPLNPEEKSMYASNPIKPTVKNIPSLVMGIIILLSLLILALILFLSDYFMAKVITIINREAVTDITVTGSIILQNNPDFHIMPKGLQELYKEIFPVPCKNSYKYSINMNYKGGTCLPKPYQPVLNNITHLRTLIILYLLLFLITFFRTYAERIEQFIFVAFYEKKHKSRVEVLYDNILLNRYLTEKIKKIKK